MSASPTDYMSRNELAPTQTSTWEQIPMGTAAQYLSRNMGAVVDDNYSDSVYEYTAGQSPVHINDEQYKIIKEHHNALVGHHGVENTVALLRSHDHDWPLMRTHVKRFITECDVCQKNSLRGFDVKCSKFTTGGHCPFEEINFDHIGPFTKDEFGNEHALVIIDNFSRWVDIYPVRDLQATTTAAALLKHFGTYGTPSRVKTDGGSDYRSKTMEEYVELLGCEHTINLAHSKEENAIVERANKEVARWVRDLIYDRQKGDKTKWSNFIPFAQRIHNATTVATIGCSPARIVFGTSIDLDRNIFEQRVLSPQDDEPIQEWIRTHGDEQQLIIAKAQRMQQDHHNKHVSKPTEKITEYANGELVLLGWPVTRFNPHGRPTKWDTLYRGPYQVKGHQGQSYHLIDKATGKEIPRKSVHLLKPFHYDPQRTNPTDVALKDNPDLYIIENIVRHTGSMSAKLSLQFEVKWLGYDDTTMEPWKNVRLNSVLHQYLRDNKLGKHIPKQCQ